MTDINMISHFGSRMHTQINQAVSAMELKDGAANDKAAIAEEAQEHARATSPASTQLETEAPMK
jgi:hypothetical protein